MTDEEEAAVGIKRSPGGLESLDEKDRDRMRDARDPQMERALDVLKGIKLFTQRAPAWQDPSPKAGKVANAKSGSPN